MRLAKDDGHSLLISDNEAYTPVLSPREAGVSGRLCGQGGHCEARYDLSDYQHLPDGIRRPYGGCGLRGLEYAGILRGCNG